MSAIVQAILRHLVGAFGATQIVSDDQIQQLTGALVTVLMIAWSVYDKRSREKAAQRHADPVG